MFFLRYISLSYKGVGRVEGQSCCSAAEEESESDQECTCNLEVFTGGEDSKEAFIVLINQTPNLSAVWSEA